MDYYAQGSLVAAVVALAIAGYLRVWAKNDAEARAFADLSFLIFLWCFPEYLWKTIDSAFWHRASLAAALFIPPFVLRYSGSAVRSRPSGATALAAGIWISAASRSRSRATALLLPLVERGGAFVRLSLSRAGPPHRRSVRVPCESVLDRAEEIPVSSRRRRVRESRRAPQFSSGNGNLLPAARIVRDPAVLLFHGHGDSSPPLLRVPGHRGRAIILVIQVFAFAVVFGGLEVLSGRKFWFPLAGTFLISFFLLTFYPVLMRKLGGISSDLLVRESRKIQADLGEFAKRIPEAASLAEIAQIVEEALGGSFIAGVPLDPSGRGDRRGNRVLPVRPDEYLRALGRFPTGSPRSLHGARGLAGGRRRDLGRLLGRLVPRPPAGEMVGVALFLWKEKTPPSGSWTCCSPSWRGSGWRWRISARSRGSRGKSTSPPSANSRRAWPTRCARRPG